MKDMLGMMKQIQGLQSKLSQVKDEVEGMEVSGASGGGMVFVTMTVKGLVKTLAIDDSLMKADEKDILEDLIVAALNDARGKADRLLADKMGALTAGLPLPPGMNLF